MIMSILEIIALSLESLSRNKLRAGLTMLGLIIGVFSLIFLVSIGTGTQRFILAQFEQIGSNLIAIQPGRVDAKSGFTPSIGSSSEKLTIADVEFLQKHSLNLSAVSGLVFGTGAVKGNDRSVNVSIMGCNEKMQDIITINLQQGRFLNKEEASSGRRVAVLGYGVAKKLFADINPLGKTIKINQSSHRVVGFTKKTGQLIGFNLDELVYVPSKSALRIFNEDKLFGIRAKAKSMVAQGDASKEIIELLKSRHHGKEDFTVVNQNTLVETLDVIMEALTYGLIAIAMVSVLVGGVGVMNIMLVSVRERNREIGIRRAVGARKKDILSQFLAESIALSLSGGLFGVFFAVVITYGLTGILDNFDITPPLWVYIPAFLMATGTGVLFGVLPAMKAANVDPIEALRTE